MPMPSPDEPCRVKEGEYIASFKATRTVIAMDKLLPQLTIAQWQEFRQWMILQTLVDPETDPEFRRELLSRFDVCPCCQRDLGHNRPPRPPVRARQKAFDF
jgi:hypothetical protein